MKNKHKNKETNGFQGRTRFSSVDLVWTGGTRARGGEPPGAFRFVIIEGDNQIRSEKVDRSKEGLD